MPDDFRRRSGVPRAFGSVPTSGSVPSQRAANPLHVDVGHALQSLARAARSFTLYDPHNDAVKQLIGDYQEKMSAVIRNAPIEVDVLPFEMTYRGQTVYHEEDRERSLAFRLFRDGVRRLRFDEQLTWSDLVTLLEVLSVRVTSVRQQEEDLVTLLRKASFRGISIEAVDGYVPDEERPENTALLAAFAQSPEERHEPPSDWDQPLPAAPGQAKVVYRSIDEQQLADLRSEESSEGLATEAVRAVTEVLQVAYGLRDARFRDEVMSFLEEVQEYLLVGRNLAALAALSTVYQRIVGEGQALPSLRDERAFARLVRAVPEQGDQVPEALRSLFALVPGDHLGQALEMLALDPRGARRVALLWIVRQGAAGAPDAIIARLRTAGAALASELFAILAEAAPDRRVDAAWDLLEHPDEGVQLQIVEVIASGMRGLRMARGLQHLMGSAHEQVRIRASESLGTLGGARAVPVLAEHAKRLWQLGGSSSEADAIGAAMALASADDAKPILLEWARGSKGLRTIFARIAKDSPEDAVLSYVAVAGLELCPGSDCDDAIAAVLSRASGELAWRCREAMGRRRGGSADGG